MRHVCSIISIMALALASGAFAQDRAAIVVGNIAICTSVENRQPIGRDSSFAANVGHVYCYTKLAGKTDLSTISHVWFYQDKQVSKIELTMKAKTWRTWSTKTILPEWKGDWRVEVQDSTGHVLASTAFNIK